MSVIVDEAFLRQISTRLPRFKRVGSSSTYNARCVICGDSRTNKSKARWYAFPSERRDNLVTKCHNCGYSASFDTFLEHVDPSLHKQYVIEKISGNEDSHKAPKQDKLEPRKRKQVDSKKISLPKISQLSIEHKARRYVDQRQIPTDRHYLLYYASHFNKWTNTLIPGKLDERYDEPRLVIPFFDAAGNLIGAQGRTLKDSPLRYITIMTTEHVKIYGLERIDQSQKIYVTEGPIDSLFLDNAIATADSDLSRRLDSVAEDKQQFVLVFDNEPRNKEIVLLMQRAIGRGYPICIWPSDTKQKDINDMVLAGMSKADLHRIIDKNTYQGLQAEYQLSIWKRC
jgi:hypothetical protein